MSPLTLLGRRGKLLELYRRMVLVRSFEAATGRRVDGPDAWAEMIAAAAGAALNVHDCVVTSDRPHRIALARGVAPEAVMTGLLGDLGSRRAWRIVNGGLRAATDLAPALLPGDGRRAVLCLPGSVRPAALDRSFGLAAGRRLPVVFLIRGDGPGGGRVAARVSGEDAGAVHEEVARLLARARSGRGPAVLEVVADRAPAGDIPADPLSVTAARIAELGAEPQQLLEIAAGAEEVVAAAVERVSADAVAELIATTGRV